MNHGLSQARITSKSKYDLATAFCGERATTMAHAYVLGGESAVSKKVWDALVESTVV